MTYRKILIVDDNAINRRMLQVIFENKYEILQAKDGQEAIEILQQYNYELDLMMLDLNMPRMNGFEVLDYMRENDFLGKVPVIIITSSLDMKDELRAYTGGADEIVRKPFIPEIVLRRAENLIALYGSRKELVAELATSNIQLQGARTRDALTGLLNMSHFLMAADVFLQGLTEENCHEYLFAFGNLCNFRYYNLKLGLENGNKLLKSLAQIIHDDKSNILAARFGQDHFVVLTRKENFEGYMEQVCKDFEAEYEQFGLQIKGGYYRVRHPGERAHKACELAKFACDSIRKQSRCTRAYDEQLERELVMEQYVLHNVDEAVANEWIQVHYQPILRVNSGAICGFEALTRWNDPNHGFMTPADFIPVLENAGLIQKVDQFMIRSVCKTLHALESIGHPVVPVAINLSRMDFIKCDIVDYIETVREEYHIERDLLNFEITESLLLNDMDILHKSVTRLRGLGYKVLMDDFGSGYSSLNVLKDFRFDEIKLDMVFLRNFNEVSRSILLSLVAMLKKLDVGTLAEGVETSEHLEFLKAIGCEKVQGYYICKPLPLADVLRSIADGTFKVETDTERTYGEQMSRYKGRILRQLEYTDVARSTVAQTASMSRRYGDYLEENFDENNLSSVLSVVELQNAILEALASTSASVNIINLKEDSYLKIYCMEYIDSLLRKYPSAQEALNQTKELLITDDYQEEASAFLNLKTLPQRLQNERVLHFDYNGNVTGWCRGTFVPVSYDEDGTVKEVLYIVQQIHEEKLKEEELRKLSETDGLSRINNRVSGENCINSYLEKRMEGAFCIFDVDNFKNFNDLYGHVIGDEVIRRIGVRMKKVFRSNDILMRLGGDEFGVFIAGVTSREDAENIIGRMRDAIVNIRIDGVAEKISISMGMVMCSSGKYIQFEQLYKTADALMYRNKHDKRH